MSGSTIGGVVGGVIGAFFGPVGAQVGYVVGSLVGGYIDPEVIKGPTLGDVPVQTSQEGVPRPIVFGSPPPFPGNIIQIGPKVFTTKRERQDGKGGGPVVESQEVYQSYIVRICQAEATVITIWRDGKVVFDRSGQFPVDVDGAAFASRARFYTGAEDQLPDPTFESLVGSGNQPAYRGTAYMTVTMDNLTNTGGRIPNYEFRMASVATVTDTCDEGLLLWFPLDDASPGGAAREVVQGLDGIYENFNSTGDGTVESRPSLNITGAASTWFDVTDRMISEAAAVSVATLEAWTVSVWFQLDSDAPLTGLAPLGLGYPSELTGNFGWGQYLSDKRPGGGYGDSFSTTVYEDSAVVGAGRHFMVTVYDGESETVKVYLDDILLGTVPATIPSSENVSLVQVGGGESSAFKGTAQDLKLYARAFTSDDVHANYLSAGGDYWENPDAPGTYVDINGNLVNPCRSTAEEGETTLAEIELEIARMVGISPAQFDVSADTEVIVKGALFGKQMPAADFLRMLGGVYFRDYPEYDLQIVSTPRGGPVVFSLSDDDCIDNGDDEDSLTRSQPTDLPRQINFYFSDPAASYAVVPVSTKRTSINVTSEGTLAIQAPIVLDRDEAKQRVEMTQKVIWEEAQGIRLIREIPLFQFAYITPADPFTYSSSRWRLVKTVLKEATIQIEAVRDRVSNYSSTAVANILEPPQTPVPNVKGPSILAVMNLPSLRPQDNVPGVYAGVMGLTPGWPGADLYVSPDGGVTWIRLRRMTASAGIGRLDQDFIVDSAGAPSSMFVQMFGGETLDSAGDDQLALGANGFAVNTNQVSEIGQFGTAQEDSGGVFELTDLAMHLLETAEASHFLGDQFVLLDNSLYFIPLDLSWAGLELQFKAVTIGTPIENAPIYYLTFNPLFTGPSTTAFIDTNAGVHITTNTGQFLTAVLS